jgi:DNA polymerase-3 subunit epsilon
MTELVTDDYASDQDQARAWATKLLAQPDVLLLDTETTGLHGNAEICQIAIIDVSGHVLLDTYVKPKQAIPRDASAIHGITDLTVDSAPTFDQLAPTLRELLSGMTVVIYNADFDVRMMEQSAIARSIPYEIPIFAGEYCDAMEMYAQWVGAWSRYHHNYKWQPLPGGDHSALGDCRACLRVLQMMAEPPF